MLGLRAKPRTLRVSPLPVRAARSVAEARRARPGRIGDLVFAGKGAIA
jgi:hypothetical protein